MAPGAFADSMRFRPDGVAATSIGLLPPITATTALIWTVSPSAALISVSTPATEEGISASTLSVEISNSGSSFSTRSPTFLSHLVMVPSKIDSPICGITISMPLPVARTAAGGASAAGT